MLLRAAFLYVFSVVTLVAVGFAVWQSLELSHRDVRLVELTKAISDARARLQTAQAHEQSAERRARIAEQASKAPTPDDAGLDGLRAELAAARQQLSATETAVTETEAKLADEIAAHAELKMRVGAPASLPPATTAAISPDGGAGREPPVSESAAPAVPQFKIKVEEAATPPAAATPRKAASSDVEPPRRVKKAVVKSPTRHSAKRSKQSPEPAFAPLF
jgi:hypothetical protein